MAYYAFLLLIGWVADRFQSDVAFTMMIMVGLPLLPSMMPGFILSLLLAVLDIRDFDGPHDNLFAFWPIVSAPLVNSYFALIWIKRRQIVRAPNSI